MKTEIDDNGRVTVAGQDGTWTCSTPDQAVKQIKTWTDGNRNTIASEVISAGDEEAIRDCNADAISQKEKNGTYKPTAKWIYKNDGSIVQVIGGETVLLAESDPSILQRIRNFFGI